MINVVGKHSQQSQALAFKRAISLAHRLADEWGRPEWLRGIGVVADEKFEGSYAVVVLVAKELRNNPPSQIVELPGMLSGVPIYLRWRSLAKAF